MDVIVPVADWLAPEYPGYHRALADPGFVVAPARALTMADQAQFWVLDFHTPRGVTPLGMVWNERGLGWGSQWAAERLPVPRGRGLANRMVGTHPYLSVIPVNDPAEVHARQVRFREQLPRFLADFQQLWQQRAAELDTGFRDFAEFSRCLTRGNIGNFGHADPVRSNTLASELASELTPVELSQLLRRARGYYQRAFEIHFEMMYPLLANYQGFYGLCQELHCDLADIGRFLQGRNSKITETDQQLWQLTMAAQAAGLVPMFTKHRSDQLLSVLAGAGRAAADWLVQLAEFLAQYGYRAEGVGDVALPSWLEDPTPVLRMIRAYLVEGTRRKPAAALVAAQAGQADAVSRTRRRLTADQRHAFDAALASAQQANFDWWQDEHNCYIDLRAALPLRWTALAVACQAGAEQPEDALFLFWPELLSVAEGRAPWHRFTELIARRRGYFDHWRGRRADLPKVLGTIPEAVEDPVLIEVFGLDRNYLAAVRAHVGDARTAVSVGAGLGGGGVSAGGSDGLGGGGAGGGGLGAGGGSSGGVGAGGSTSAGLECSDNRPVLPFQLSGIPAAAGRSRGRARVLHDSDRIAELRPGDVLVCESISPNWTPVFATIAGCVCDCGGMLSHAAIVGREYQVPTVAGCGRATELVADGDELEIDGGLGLVTILRRRLREP